MIPLFTATMLGRPLTVLHAGRTELQNLQRTIRVGSKTDILDGYSLLAFRELGAPRPRVHALGWSVEMSAAWLTANLAAVDLSRSRVRTVCGDIFSLGEPDEPHLDQELRSHLSGALRLAGYLNIREPARMNRLPEEMSP